jgi:hypothetical protein
MTMPEILLPCGVLGHHGDREVDFSEAFAFDRYHPDDSLISAIAALTTCQQIEQVSSSG